MKIEDIFEKDITRAMNPVIKVNDLDDSALYQELDEYVVTKDIDKNFEKLYKAVAKGFGGGDKDHIGVWISGDFGSGKSHFLKICSFLLQNRVVKDKKAVDYFRDKPGLNEVTLRMMQDVGRREVETILFDIDSKSKRSQDEDALAQVFMGVFNEKLGLCFDNSVAKMERYLEENGLYDDFKQQYKSKSGKEWTIDRTRAAFVIGKVAEALVACGAYSSMEEAKGVADSIAKESPVSVEEFANLVGEYCESRGPGYNLFFMVDEVGQFISKNVQKMLKLQTLTECIGVRCKGQAWIIVTSQEDVDAIVSEVSSNDFSKIQGRFTTRIKMTSSNVKEVIEKRVLQKKEGAWTELGVFYESNRTDIQNKLGMINQAEIRLYRDAKEFADTYPFIPYQYSMLQDMLTSLRNKSASGKNLSNAARSMLRIFKDTAASASEMDTNYITPLYAFYDAIQPELDSPTNIVFNNAAECSRLDDFDINVLKTLFLVKYYDKLDKTLDNIAALMTSSFSDKRGDLKEEVEDSLKNLVRENFVQAYANTYMFLSNEEQEISREIRNEVVDQGMIYKDISDVAFGNIFNLSSGKLKGRQFNKFVEDENIMHTDYELSVRILITNRVTDPFIPETSADSILFKIPDGKMVVNAFADYLRTENYIRKKEGTQQAPGIKSILDGKHNEIKFMREYARSLLDTALKNSRVFINRNESTISDSLSPEKRLSDAMDALVASVYNKHEYVDHTRASKEIDGFLETKILDTYENVISGMQNAFEDLIGYMESQETRNVSLVVKDIMDRYRKKPYGFETEDVQWMLAVLLKYGRIDLTFEGKSYCGAGCSYRDAKNCILTSKNYDKVRVNLRQAITQNQIIRASDIIRVLFAKTSMKTEESVVRECNAGASARLDEINSCLEIYRNNPKYPGRDTFVNAREAVEKLFKLKSPELFTFIDENEEKLRNLNDEIQYIFDFLQPDSNSRKLFDRGISTLDRCNSIRVYLDQDTKDKLGKISGILDSGVLPDLPKLNCLCDDVDETIDATTEHVRNCELERLKNIMEQDGHLFEAYPELCEKFRNELACILEEIQNGTSIPQIMTAIGSISGIISSLKAKIPEPLGPGHEPSAPPIESPTSKNAKIMVRTIAPTEVKTIGSEQDIEVVLNGMREKMKEKLASGPFDIIW